MQNSLIFVVTIGLFLQFTGEIRAQDGVFDPTSFTSASCAGENQWTMWFDAGKPTLVQGEFEVTKVIQSLFPAFMCPTPVAIEAKTLQDKSPTTTGDVFRITAADGFLCLNQQINGFREKMCTDYKVRYCCLKSTIGQTATTTTRAPVTLTAPVASGSCGRQLIAPSAHRIVGGAEAIPYSWPWIVSIQTSDHFCGGTLIDSRHVLTAAHCLTSVTAGQIRVIAGLHERSKRNTAQTQNVGVSRIFIHEQYSASTQAHDIAILRLSQPVQLNTYVNVICLPGPDPQELNSVTVAGWGATKREIGLPNALQQVTVQVINGEASRAYGSMFDVRRQIGAGIPQVGGKDSCQGDSGGPLMYKGNGVWYLTGVVSFGNDCALRLNPGVYTRTSFYLSWIQSRINSMK